MIPKQTKQFYMQMGYSENQVVRANEYAKTAKIDLYDALQFLQNQKVAHSSPSSMAHPVKQPQTSSKQKGADGVKHFSFLRPIKQVKTTEYQNMFPKSKNSNRTEIREETTPVGLLNVSNCCYLNSLLQCYFLMNDVVIQIFDAEPISNIQRVLHHQSSTKIKRIKNQYNLLLRFKEFFAKMTLTSKKYVDPSDILRNLVDSVGDKLSYGQEKDLFQINIGIIQRLSECLMYTKKYFKPNQEKEQLPPLELRSSFVEAQQVQHNKSRYSSILKIEKSPIKKLFYGTKVEYFQQEKEKGFIEVKDNNGIDEKSEPICTDFLGIIINPVHHNLYQALQEQFNYEVELQNKKVMKHTYIREQPQYFFFYINRLSFDKEEKQLHKNEDKFTFDFAIYLDRFLEKYKENTVINDPLINELLAKKNTIMKQLNHLEILAKKIEQCLRHARELEGWIDKFPQEEEVDMERSRLRGEFNRIELQLEKIQSRKEKYLLAYIFVHRGDAVSGHYWGYGKNGDNWYRFDINCKKLKEKQIITDMEKSGGTPYSLVYVKEKYIPNFPYKYHLEKVRSNEPNLLDFDQKKDKSEFFLHIDKKMEDALLQQNVQMHKQEIKRNNSLIIQKTINEYLLRLNIIKKLKNKAKSSQKGSQIPIYNNFSLYLYSIEEIQLSKYIVFEQSLFYSSKILVEKLFQKDQSVLLHTLQKKFRRKCRGQYHLKQYALMGKEQERFHQFEHEYHLGKTQIIWGLKVMQIFSQYITQTDILRQTQEINKEIKDVINELIKFIKIRRFYQHFDAYKKIVSQKSPLYISCITNEVQTLILLKLALDGFKISQIQNIKSSLSGESFNQIVYLMKYNEPIKQIDSLGQQQNQIDLNDVQTMISQFNSIAKKEPKLERNPSQSRDSNLLQTSASKIFYDSAERFSRSEESFLMKSSQPKAKGYLEIWKSQDLEKSLPNYDYFNTLMSFLKQLKQIVPLYKKIEKQKKVLTSEEVNLAKLKIILRKEPEPQIPNKQEQQSLI